MIRSGSKNFQAQSLSSNSKECKKSNPYSYEKEDAPGRVLKDR